MRQGLIKLLACLSLTMMVSLSVLADFSGSTVDLHPQFPATGPFILEISGIWPTDCHPGEQKPVIRSFDGQSLEIEFEIVIVHITCNDRDTEYRSLVDISDVLRSTKASGDMIDVRVDFQGESFGQSVELVCLSGSGCAESQADPQFPERGLYVSPGRPSEGILVGRQNNIASIIPMVYDESGKSEWLFSVSSIVDDSYFAELSRWAGGSCFDCEPEGAEPLMSHIGYLSVLVDRPDTLWVKVNDRPFSEYQRLVYGYSILPFLQTGNRVMAGLDGRWALSENHGTDSPLGDLTNFLPPAFDIALEIGTAGIGQVSYLVSTITGSELGQLICDAQTNEGEQETICEFIDPTDQSEPLLLFTLDGPASLSIEYGRAVIAIGTPPGGKAVRLD